MSAYHNFKGEPVETAQQPQQKKRGQPRTRRVDCREAATISLGFTVTGIAGDSYQAAKEAAGKDGKDFDHFTYVRHARRFKMNPTPYAQRHAAEQCAEMARRVGFLEVVVEELFAVETATSCRLL